MNFGLGLCDWNRMLITKTGNIGPAKRTYVATMPVLDIENAEVHCQGSLLHADKWPMAMITTHARTVFATLNYLYILP